MTGDDEREDRDRLDLSALDLTRNPGYLDRFVRRVRAAALPELLRRQSAEEPDLGSILVLWRARILGGSGFLAAIAALVLLAFAPHTSQRAAGGGEPVSSSDIARVSALPESLGVPSALAGYVTRSLRPSTADLLELKENGR